MPHEFSVSTNLMKKSSEFDVESLFTNVPVEETIEYILDEIYVNKKLKPLCKSRLIMKRLLQRLISDCQFRL